MILSRVLYSCSTSGSSLKSAASAIVGFKSNLFDSLSNKLNLERYARKHFTHDYCVLLIQRPQTFPTFGGHIVFPGGLLSEPDSSAKCWPIFENLRLFQASVIPDTYKNLGGSSCYCKANQSLDPAISFRLCAIRELFEETGLLLVENQNDLDGLSAHAVLLENDQLEIWQKRIAHNQSAFADLYSYLRCSPPVRALHEWSSWKSPPIMKNRFDTMFYFVEIQLILNHDEQQHASIKKWKSSETEILYADAPPAFLQNQSKRGTYLFKSIAPPQAYELCRLVHFDKLEQLRKFSHERSHLGSRSWCPLPATGMIDSQLCTFLFLPGDQRYAELLEHWQRTNSPAKFDPNWDSDTHRNRFQIGATKSETWFDCTTHELGHLLPVSFSEFSSKFS